MASERCPLAVCRKPALDTLPGAPAGPTLHSRLQRTTSTSSASPTPHGAHLRLGSSFAVPGGGGGGSSCGATPTPRGRYGGCTPLQGSAGRWNPCCKCLFRCLPDALIEREIFSFLDLRSLLATSAVCTRWNYIAEQPQLWRTLTLPPRPTPLAISAAAAAAADSGAGGAGDAVAGPALCRRCSGGGASELSEAPGAAGEGSGAGAVNSASATAAAPLTSLTGAGASELGSSAAAASDGHFAALATGPRSDEPLAPAPAAAAAAAHSQARPAEPPALPHQPAAPSAGSAVVTCRHIGTFSGPACGVGLNKLLVRHREAIESLHMRAVRRDADLPTRVLQRCPLPRLSALDLSGSKHLSGDAVAALVLAQAPVLTRLTLDGVAGVEDGNLSGMLAACAGLRHLSLAGLRGLTDASLQALLDCGAAAQLVTLVLDGCNALSAGTVARVVAAAGDRLRQLQVRGVRGISDELLAAVATHAPKLVVADFGCANPFGDGVLPAASPAAGRSSGGASAAAAPALAAAAAGLSSPSLGAILRSTAASGSAPVSAPAVAVSEVASPRAVAESSLSLSALPLSGPERQELGAATPHRQSAPDAASRVSFSASRSPQHRLGGDDDSDASQPGALHALPLSASHVTDAGLLRLASACAGLRSLRLQGHSRISDGAWAAALRSVPQLEVLDARHCRGLGSRGLQALTTHLGGQLQELRLCGCLALDDEGAGRVLGAMRRLRTLDLHGCRGIVSADTLVSVAATLHPRGLQSLHIGGIPCMRPLLQPVGALLSPTGPAAATCAAPAAAAGSPTHTVSAASLLTPAPLSALRLFPPKLHVLV